MQKKRKTYHGISGILTVCLLGAALTGCGNTVQTQQEIVVPKETQQGAAQPAETGGAVSGGIQEQVQAPESWQETFSDDRTMVTIDAPIVIPEAEGFRTKKVVSRVFAQEDYDKVSEVLLGGGALWDRDGNSASNGFTKGEITERIEQLEAEKAAGVSGSEMYGGKEISYDETIAEWKKMLEAAPDEAVTADKPAVVNYTENGGEANYLMGYVTAGGQDYFVSLDNDLREDWRWIKFDVYRNDVGGNFMPLEETLPGQTEAARNSALAGRTDEIRQKAADLIKQLDFSELAAAGEEYMATVTSDEKAGGDLKLGNLGYGIHYTRLIDNIPVTYTHHDGTAMEGDWSSWPYEVLTVIYDEKGFAGLSWTDPYHMEDLSGDYEFLLPFSEIQQVVREMMLKKYEDHYKDSGWKLDFSISEVRLGYMRIMEKGNPKEGTMIPVWDFFGSRTVDTLGQGEDYTFGGPYESWLTINAMDGTVIDRDLGY